jgi:hypothetical protein
MKTEHHLITIETEQYEKQYGYSYSHSATCTCGEKVSVVTNGGSADMQATINAHRRAVIDAMLGLSFEAVRSR